MKDYVFDFYNDGLYNVNAKKTIKLIKNGISTTVSEKKIINIRDFWRL